MLSISQLFVIRFVSTLISVSLSEPTLIAALVGLVALAIFLIIGVMRRRALNDYADKRYNAFFNSNPLPAWIVDPSTGKIEAANDSALVKYGFSREDFLKKTLSDLNAAPAVKGEKRLGEYESPVEFTHLTRNGDEILVTLHSEDLILNGKPARLVYALDTTEKSRAAEALRRSEERILRLFDTSPVAVLLIRLEGQKIVDVNKAFTELTGWPADRVRGRTAADCGLYSDDVSHFFVDQLKAQGSLADVEIEIHGLDGDLRNVIAGASPFEIQGEPHCILTLFDITERRRAHDLSRESDERLRIVTENARVGLVIIDRELKYTFVNAAYAEIFDSYPEEILGHAVEKIHGRNYNEQIQHRLERAFAGERVSFELHRRTPLRERYYAVRFEPTFTGNDVSFVVEVTTEITEKYESELARQASEERYHTLFEYAPDGILIADPESNYVDANQTMCRMLGYDRSELVGMHATDILVPREIPHIGEELGGLNVDLDFYRDWQFRRKDGSVFPGEVIANRMPDGNTLTVVRDVSDRKHLEGQLLQAQKMEAIGVLAGGIAHDFNNVLNAIIGFSDLSLEKTAPEDPRYQYLEQIKFAGERATALTRKILAFGRKQILTPQIHNLNNSIGGMEPLLKHLIKENVEFSLDLDPKLGNIKSDPGQIEQVIMNLVVNAHDAMPNGGKVKIATRNIDLPRDAEGDEIGITPGRYVKMSVSDTGTGMDQETRRRLFEPFFTTKAIGKGTGLGLSIAYGIVKQSDGDIRVASEPGKGSVFSIYLPIVERDVSLTPVKLGEKREPRSFRETILLVEDDNAVRNFVFQVLVEKGCKVLEAESGAAALAIARVHSGPIHLLLTDVIMPQMDGLELRNRLVEFRPEVPVLFMSGYTDETIPLDEFSRIDAAFIEKPFTAEALMAKIGEVFSKSRDLLELSETKNVREIISTAASGKSN